MKTTLFILSMVALVLGGPEFKNTGFNVLKGQPFTLEFFCPDTCSLILRNGPRDDLRDYRLLTGNASGSSFTFTPENLPTDSYTFQIIDNSSGEDNYSITFQYKGDHAASTTSSEKSSKTESSSTSSTSTSSTSTSTSHEATKTSSSSAESSTASAPSSSSSSSSSSSDSTPTSSDAGTATETPGATHGSDRTGGAGTLAVPISMVLAFMATFYMI